MSLFDRFRSAAAQASPTAMKRNRSMSDHFHDSNQGGQQAAIMTTAKSETAMSDSLKSHTTALSLVAEAFEELAHLLNNSNADSQLLPDDQQQEAEEEEVELRLDSFCQACSLVSVLFSSLGLAFKFAETEYVAKVRDLVEASKTFPNLQSVVDVDVAKGTVRTAGSHTRNLRRVRQGLDLIRGIFQQFLSSK
ncbi:ACD11 homolog protein [Linum grandiflorum]